MASASKTNRPIKLKIDALNVELSKIWTMDINKEIIDYNDVQGGELKKICQILAHEIYNCLPDAENKIWHAHPVWFLDGNPIVGYSKLKAGIRLLFWSGVSFDEVNLKPGTGKFKDASILYTSPEQINKEEVFRWLKKARDIQWDYKNVIKRKGKLDRLK